MRPPRIFLSLTVFRCRPSLYNVGESKLVAGGAVTFDPETVVLEGDFFTFLTDICIQSRVWGLGVIITRGAC